MPEAGVDPINICGPCLSVSPGNHCKGIAPHPTCRPYHLAGLLPAKRQNIIPEDVMILRGNIRTMDYKISKPYAFDRIEEVILSIQTAYLFRGRKLWREIASAPPLQNDSDMVKGLPATWKNAMSLINSIAWTRRHGVRGFRLLYLWEAMLSIC